MDCAGAGVGAQEGTAEPRLEREIRSKYFKPPRDCNPDVLSDWYMSQTGGI